jgi:hypothetical protein
MAYGSMKAMFQYAEKVFSRSARFRQISDARTNPAVPLAEVLQTWQWGLIRRLPSTEQIGDLLADPRWRALLGLQPEQGGSPDSAARILDGISIQEWNQMLLEDFFTARRAGVLSDSGQYGLRCAALDLNELFSSESIHCPHCQVREKTVTDSEGNKRTVLEYYHQAVALTWISGEIPFPIGWEILAPGEGELTAALRLLERLLPALRRSVDLILGDALYCCRPFFKTVTEAGLHAVTISSQQTEMDQEIALWKQTSPPRITGGPASEVAVWELESEAWKTDLKRKLRVIDCERRYQAPSWKHERRNLRVVTTTPLELLPAGQGWKVGRSRWIIENGTFNRMTSDYALEHNYRHSVSAIAGLLAMRSFAFLLTMAYHRHAIARSRAAPDRFVKWFRDIVVEDWVRFLDLALKPRTQPSG